jgi:hypothetical protein
MQQNILELQTCEHEIELVDIIDQANDDIIGVKFCHKCKQIIE